MADALQRLIREALDRGSEIAWGRLLSFSYWGLGCPGESGGVRQVSLSTLVRQQVAQFMEGTDLPAVKVTTRRRDGVRGGDETLKRRVAAKFAEGDVSGAVRELASAEGLAPQDRDTLRALKEKHPSAPENLSLPDPPDGSVVPAVATEEDVRKAIMSFRAGASGGPDGLRPGHLRSLVAHGSAEAGARLLSTLTDLVNVMLRGEVPQFAVPVLYGANECAIRKKDGGIRPIAVGSSLRRLAVKVGSRPIVQALGEELRPVQLGVSTRGGCEAAAHAARRYARDCRHRRVLLKIDMRNAFNSLRRDSFCLWHVLERLAFTVSCGRPTHLRPDYSLAKRGLPRRRAFSRETQLDPHSLLYPLMKQPEVFSLNSMCGIWTMLPSETPQRGFMTI